MINSMSLSNKRILISVQCMMQPCFAIISAHLVIEMCCRAAFELESELRTVAAGLSRHGGHPNT